MELLIFLLLFYVSRTISAQDMFQGQFRESGACFPTVKSTVCNVPLWKTFTSKYPVNATIEPQTLVYLFTPSSPEAAEALHECSGRLPPDSTYDPDANTEIFIHGFLDGLCRTAWMRECKEQLFQRATKRNSAYNVILVDWTWGNTPAYVAATHNLKIVGEHLSLIVNNIMEQKGVRPEKFHVIGHSLGAIIAGYIGRGIKGKLRRITALDPALPLFDRVPPSERVTYRDAKIVDVIHSNAYNCPKLYFGDSRLLGHADFYPNGGSTQASCITYLIESFLKNDLFYALASFLPNFCSHLQSIQYYKLSINPRGCQYVGVASDSFTQFQNQSSANPPRKAVMGMDYELYQRRGERRQQRYFLATTMECPYYDDSYSGDSEHPYRTPCKDDANAAAIGDVDTAGIPLF